MADSNYVMLIRLNAFSLLPCIKKRATGKKEIESMQSLEMDNVRVAYTRFLAFYSGNPSGHSRWSNSGEMAK